MIVDSLEGEEELVIKALDDRTVETNLVSGASILGDGRVVLILNLASIIDRSARSNFSHAEQISSGLLLTQADRARSVSRSEVRQ
jgi:chemotaxis protein histidine kinase CheA